MAEGFVAAQNDGASTVGSWHPDAPNRRWWGLKLDKAKLVGIVAFRCDRCGLLEQYAPT